jgi:hypothetical protein
MKAASTLVCSALLLLAGAACAQDVNGSLTAHGKSAPLEYAFAQQVDSVTEKGYMDVVVVLSDRKLAPGDARSAERLEQMTRNSGLVALIVKINPDAKVMSAQPLHPAFKTFVSSAAFVRWKPTAYDEKRVAGRLWTDGTQDAFGEQWSYDVTFSTPIALDPAAKTVPKK